MGSTSEASVAAMYRTRVTMVGGTPQRRKATQPRRAFAPPRRELVPLELSRPGEFAGDLPWSLTVIERRGDTTVGPPVGVTSNCSSDRRQAPDHDHRLVVA